MNKLSLITLIVFVGTSTLTRGERLLQNYRDMKVLEETSPPPAYFQQSQKSGQAAKSASPDKNPVRPELAVSARHVEEMKKSWSAKANQPANEKLFYDFENAAFAKARKRARSKEFEAILARPVTLEFLLAAAFEHNPKIAALQKAWMAAIEKYPQSLYLDNILQQYNAFTKQLNTKTTGKPRQKEMVSFKFPFPGTLALKGNIIEQDVRIAFKDYEIGLRDIMTMLRLSYEDYIYILKAIEITKENKGILEDFESTARKKYEGGQATFNDVIKAQVELSKLSDDLITLHESRDTTIARINTLLNLDPQAKLGPPTGGTQGDIPLPLGKLFPIALKEQQEIRRIELMIRKMDMVIELGTKMFHPDATLGAGYFEDRSRVLFPSPPLPLGEGRGEGAQGSRSTFNPSPRIKHRFWFGKDDAYIREVRQKRDALKEKLRAKKDTVHFDLKNTHFQWDAARRQRDLYEKTLLPQASQNLQTARIAYQGAKVSFLDLLDAERLWLNFNLKFHRFARDYRKGSARIEQLVGTRFEALKTRP